MTLTTDFLNLPMAARWHRLQPVRLPPL